MRMLPEGEGSPAFRVVSERPNSRPSPSGRGQGEGSDVAPTLAMIGVEAGDLGCIRGMTSLRRIASDPRQGWG